MCQRRAVARFDFTQHSVDVHRPWDRTVGRIRAFSARETSNPAEITITRPPRRIRGSIDVVEITLWLVIVFFLTGILRSRCTYLKNRRN